MAEKETGEMKTWHENDEFWETMGTMMFSERRWEIASAEMYQVVPLLDVNPGGAVLDLCCGPGRHSLELSRRGFIVTGVDRTAAYLERAKANAESEDLSIEFVEADMRMFYRPDAFDGAIMMYTSFGYFEDPTENLQVLLNVYRSLKEGGALVMDLMGKEVLARIFQERGWDEDDGVIYLQERKVCKDWSWIENRWILIRDQERHEFNTSHWVYSATELFGMLIDCGFETVKVYGDLEGAPYDHTAKRLVVVARK
jgi:SAM-dependent methyltransferase